ncbi:phage tail protein [Ferrimicrobium sp.]|uniref:phage tail protein n=1 Tax=Ferrimicrobium sp. TaxID=2926050 RepID=UPI00262AF146|nr:phage tail protein [Ferrimicrobium sp.]
MVTTSGFKGHVPDSSSFLLEVDGTQIGMFAEVSGLEVTVEVASYAEGGQNGFVHKFPGRMNWPNIVLRRGICESDALFAWVMKSSGSGFASNQNKLSVSTAAITLIGSDGKRLRAWEVTGAFPVRWVGPELAVASTGHPAMEEIELAHQGFVSKTFKS